MAVLNRLVKDFPDSADPLGLMGDLYVELGKTAEAARYRKKFKEMKARDFQTLPDKRDYVLHHRFLVKSRRRNVEKPHERRQRPFRRSRTYGRWCGRREKRRGRSSPEHHRAKDFINFY